MKDAVCATLLVLVLILAANSCAAAQKPDALNFPGPRYAGVMTKSSTAVDFTLNAQGNIVVLAGVTDSNGRQSVLRLVVDTGASNSMISSRAVSALGLKAEPLLDAAGKPETVPGITDSYITLPTMTLGDGQGELKMRGLPLAVTLPGSYFDDSQESVDGLLGDDFLSLMPFSVDYRSQTLTFFDRSKSPKDLLQSAHMEGATAEDLVEANGTYLCACQLSLAGKSITASLEPTRDATLP